MAELDAEHACAGLRHLRRLTIGEIESALAALPAGRRAEPLRAAGLRTRSSDPPDRCARLLAARIRSLSGGAAHNVLISLTDAPRARLMQLVGDDDALLVEEVRAAIAGPLAGFPSSLLGALFALLGELGAYAPERGDELIALLDGRETAEPQDATAGAEEPEPVEALAARAATTAPIADEPVSSPLDDLIRDAILRAHADPARLATAGDAVAELLALDPTRARSWGLRGFLDAVTSEGRSPLQQPFPPASVQWCGGVIAGLCATGRVNGLREFVAANVESAARLVSSGEVGTVMDSLLRSLVTVDPRTGTELCSAVQRPFSGWEGFVCWLRAHAQGISGEKSTAALALLRACDEMLTSWTALVAPADIPAIERAAAEVAVERVRVQRCVGDFYGAATLVSRIDQHVLPAGTRQLLLEEAALVACELTSISSVAIPSTAADRDAARARFARARLEIDAAVGAGSPVVGPALRGVLALAEGDQRRAVADLRAAASALRETGASALPELHAKLLFHLALNELALLEPGTADAAAEAVDTALAAGHRPPVHDLVGVATALYALDSPRAIDAVERVLNAAPAHPTALDTLLSLARRGCERAVSLASRTGRDLRLPRSTRFELLESAIMVASAGGCPSIDIEELVDEAERIVAKSGDGDLDRRWAGVLATNDSLRELVGADAVDLVRLQVLRRSGEVDDAASLACHLFYRSLSGHVGGADPADLVELAESLGAGGEEVAALRRLLPNATASPPDELQLSEPVRVLFVGGNETQARARSSVDGAVAERYGGAVTVGWHTTGWSGNWGHAAAEIEARFDDAGALVLMTFVRTMLGRRLRRTAGEAGVPWIACTGHGRASIERAIDRAVRVACRSRA